MGNYKELKEFSEDFQRNWQRIVPDYVINYGEEGKVIVEVKAISKDGSVGSGKIEERALGILNLLGLGNTRYTACKLHCIPELSYFDKRRRVIEVVVGYDDKENAICFTGFEGIVCKECFENPSKPADVRAIFKKFKKYREKQWANIDKMDFKEQVRSAVTRINEKFKKEFNIDEEVLIYSAVQTVTINKKYFY